MFESSIINALSADAELVSYLSTYNNAPAIFSAEAPEPAELPFIVFNITRSSVDYSAVQSFTVMINYFDWNKSRSNSRKVAERIEFLLDKKTLEHDRYKSIRMSFFAGSEFEGADPRTIQYNLQFSARAGRKKWIDQFN